MSLETPLDDTRRSAIRAVALDVDGTLTDGSFYWGPNGEEWKRFHFLDVMGISRARQDGYIFALISGEDTPLVDRYADKMSIEHVYKGCKDKAAALSDFAAKTQISLDVMCFMGDDINDISALKIAGLAAAPANAHPTVKAVADKVTHLPGGSGAVRELLDWLRAT